MDKSAHNLRHIRTAAGALLTAVLLLLSSCARGTLPSSVPPETGGPTVPAQEVPDFVLENVLLRIRTKQAERNELYNFFDDEEGFVIENEIELSYNRDGTVSEIHITDFGVEGLRAVAQGKPLKNGLLLEWKDGRIRSGRVFLGADREVSSFVHEYDAEGRLVKTTLYGGSRIVLTEGDATGIAKLGRSLSVLSDLLENVPLDTVRSETRYTYDSEGHVSEKQVKEPNGPYTLTYLRDEAAKTCTVRQTSSDQTTFTAGEIRYDASGRVASEKTRSDLNEVLYTYEYDDGGALLKSTMKRWTGDPLTGSAFTVLGDVTYNYSYEYGRYEQAGK